MFEDFFSAALVFPRSCLLVFFDYSNSYLFLAELLHIEWVEERSFVGHDVIMILCKYHRCFLPKAETARIKHEHCVIPQAKKGQDFSQWKFISQSDSWDGSLLFSSSQRELKWKVKRKVKGFKKYTCIGEIRSFIENSPLTKILGTDILLIDILSFYGRSCMYHIFYSLAKPVRFYYSSKFDFFAKSFESLSGSTSYLSLFACF